MVDTSVLISALIGPKGPSRSIIRACLKEQFKPLISNSLFQEYEAVSSRPKIRDLCPLNTDEIRSLLNAFYSACEWVPVYYLWRPNLRDEDDNFLIELAIAGNSNCIVTNNIKDMKNSELIFPELKIVSPEQLLGGG